ncbi:hypothetical protein ACWC4D_33820 [Streptomyces sp. NPDC001288]
MAAWSGWGTHQKGIVLDGWPKGLRALGMTDEELSAPRLSPELIQRRFMRKVVVAPAGCWEWSGVRTERGYGRVRIGKREFGAHRVALVIATGRSLLDGEYACHRCDNPPCVNPAHLFHGDALSNMQDMAQKGRHVSVAHQGQANGQAKLTEPDVRWIRSNTHIGTKDAAEQFGVSTSLIRQVRSGEAWGWVA